MVPFYTGKFTSLNTFLMHPKSYFLCPLYFVHFIILHMKQLNSNKRRFPRFDKILVISPLQRCMVRVMNDNSAQRLIDSINIQQPMSEHMKVQH